MVATGTSALEIPGFKGQLIHPDDAEYDEARTVFNAMIDRKPVLIARCTSADDVVAAVNVAREQDLPLSVYGGGHSVTGHAVVDAGLCIDLRGMKRIDVDPDAQTVRAEGGVTWGEFDAATQEHGLAVTGGRVTTTGIGGLALGSGSGWLERKLGFTCDNLVKAEVVTADGRTVIASADENDDLFWGLRGGGGNFGIVTAFHLQLHPIGPIVLGGLLMYPHAMAADVLRFWRDYITAAPDDVGSAMAFITAPPEDFVPEPVRGQPVVGVVLAYFGDDLDKGEEVLRPMREFGPPGMDIVDRIPYVAVQQLIDPPNQKGFYNYWTADFIAELPDEAIDIWVAHTAEPSSPFNQMLILAGGGAVTRVDEDATAFPERTSPFNTHYLGMWSDPADTEKNIAYTRALADAMKPWTTGRAYLNFLGDEGTARVASAFGPEKYQRLQALKATWDPTNLFRHNQNIPPA
jgi:FAD/FMN-containing dehydrogenase